MENIINKISKLLALSKSVNENEGKNALMLAQKLLLKHNLSMADVEIKNYSSKVIEVKANNISLYSEWARALASIVAENFRCRLLISHWRRYSRAIFVGYQHDEKKKKNVFDYTAKLVKRLSRKYVDEHRRLYSSTRRLKRSYINGFITGLKRGWEQQINEEYALVSLVPKEVNEEVDNKYEVIGDIGEKAVDERLIHDAVKDGYNEGLNAADKKKQIAY